MSYPPKPAGADHPILDVIQNRWSPLAFSAGPIGNEKIAQLFEAARWAQSSFNEQPWLYVYAEKNDPNRTGLESLLVDGNAWAKNAGLLLISFAKKTFARNGKPNRHYLHDLGAASALITLQATNLGLITHQMAGFAVDKANAALGVPDEYEPGSMMAVGEYGDPSELPDDLRKREEAPRSRKKQEEFALKGKWSKD